MGDKRSAENGLIRPYHLRRDGFPRENRFNADISQGTRRTINMNDLRRGWNHTFVQHDLIAAYGLNPTEADHIFNSP